jgi:hypothetical protein
MNRDARQENNRMAIRKAHHNEGGRVAPVHMSFDKLCVQVKVIDFVEVHLKDPKWNSNKEMDICLWKMAS